MSMKNNTRMALKGACLIAVSILMLLLFACKNEDRLHRLQNEIAQLEESTSRGEKKPAPINIPLPQPITYDAELIARRQPGSEDATNASNPLYAYPVNAYQFVGTIIANNVVNAYLQTPDNIVLSVKEGDIISNNYAKIVKINFSHIEVSENYSEPGKPPKERIVILKLKE